MGVVKNIVQKLRSIPTLPVLIAREEDNFSTAEPNVLHRGIDGLVSLFEDKRRLQKTRGDKKK